MEFWGPPENDSDQESTYLDNDEAEQLRQEAATRVRERSREELYARGKEMLEWIQNPDQADCPIAPSTMTSAQVVGLQVSNNRSQDVIRSRECVEDDLIVPQDFDPEHWIYWSVLATHTTLAAHFGRGAMVINIMARPKGLNSPHISELAVACYAHDHPIESLQYVFVHSIVNKELRQYLKALAPSDRDLHDGLSFNHGSQEYFEFMGTRIGRVVGSIVLAGLARGSRRITSVHIWKRGWAPNMRFDIGQL